jgi:hypothetical protein
VRTGIGEDYRTLIRYFLGELPEVERETVEERYMLDETYAELRDEAEMDLVDAYVGGALTPLERQHFEREYLVTRERREGVKAAYLSRVYRERIAQPTAPAPAASKIVFFPQRFTIPAVAAAIVVFAIGGAGWLMYRWWGMQREIRGSVPHIAGVDQSKQRSPVGARGAPRNPPTKTVNGLAVVSTASARSRALAHRGPKSGTARQDLVSQLESEYLWAASNKGGSKVFQLRTLVVRKPGIVTTPMNSAPGINRYEDRHIVADAGGANQMAAGKLPQLGVGDTVYLLGMEFWQDALVFEIRSRSPQPHWALVTIRFPKEDLEAADFRQVERKIREVFGIARTDGPAVKPGQTEEQVVGLLGPPQAIASLSSKTIYVYNDVKLTFHGKLSDISGIDEGPQISQ